LIETFGERRKTANAECAQGRHLRMRRAVPVLGAAFKAPARKWRMK